MWYDILACLVWSAALVGIGYYLGKHDERVKRNSREEAIRAQAYKDGFERAANVYLVSMNPVEWHAIYNGQLNSKESV
jgi:hypothetical protein